MNKLKVFFSILAVPLGISLAVFSEYDDAPGGVLIGFLMVVAGIIGIMRSRKKIKDS